MTRVLRLAGLMVALSAAARAGEDAAPGAIRILVNASEPRSSLLRATLTIPVRPGPLRLHYPRWPPGLNAASDGIRRISHLSMQAGSTPLEWRRDPKDPWSFLCTIPEGADALTVALALTVDFDQGDAGWESGSTGTLTLVSWGNLLLYPAGSDVDELRVRASLRLPEGWRFATSLEEIEGAREGGDVRFREVTLREIVDSPVATGPFVAKIPLVPATTGVPHVLALVGGREAEAPSPVIDGLVRALEQTHAVLGAPPMDRFTFLVLVSGAFAGGGLEHQRSTVIFGSPAVFDTELDYTADTLVHEYVHAWNGKRHAPAGLLQRDFQEAPDFRLLWVYEGLTSYLSWVIAVRSGFRGLDALKQDLAWAVEISRSDAVGGAWRSLEDVSAAAPLASPDLHWKGRRRDQAHYGEGALLWLEVDCLLRTRSDGRYSLDDFCRRFFGRAAEGPVVAYDEELITKTLASLVETDWQRFLDARVRATGVTDRDAGLRASGWELRTAAGFAQIETSLGTGYRAHGATFVNLLSSIGVVVGADGTVLDVTAGGAADAAGIGPGTKITGVNDKSFDLNTLVRGVGATKRIPLRLAVVQGVESRTIRLDYSAGLRWPTLKRAKGPDLLGEIARPVSGK